MHICMRDIRNDGVAHDWGGVIHSAVLYYADMLCYSPQAQRSMPRTRSWSAHGAFARFARARMGARMGLRAIPGTTGCALSYRHPAAQRATPGAP